MSIFVLARKTKATAPRFRSDKCFILNMTGRGGVIGQSAKSNNSQCKTKGGCKNGQVSTCCNANKISDDDKCNRWSNSNSRPAPQLSYRNYINKRSNSAYRSGGFKCCDNINTNNITCKQMPNISSSEITQQNKDKQLGCEGNKKTYCKNNTVKYVEIEKKTMVIETDGTIYGYENEIVNIGKINNNIVNGRNILLLGLVIYKSDNTSFVLELDDITDFCFHSIIFNNCSNKQTKQYFFKDSKKIENEDKFIWQAKNNDDIDFWRENTNECVTVTFQILKEKKEKRYNITKTMPFQNNRRPRANTFLKLQNLCR